MFNKSNVKSQGRTAGADEAHDVNAAPMSQKDAVYSAVEEVVGTVKEGVDYSREVNAEQRRQMTDILVDGFKSGVITLQTQFPSEQSLRTYCTGLLSNWLRKDKRLNGGTNYIPKNPGSRTGRPASDPQLTALKNLLAQVQDENEREEIRGYIEQREQELHGERIIKNVDVNALPEGLRTRYSKEGSSSGRGGGKKSAVA